jgi:S-adenosylmethionine uptake transporter
VLSIIFLKEQVGWRRWTSVAVGLLGTLIVTRPGFRELEIGHLAAALCACFIGCAMLLLRIMGTSERPARIVTALSLVNTVALLPIVLWEGFPALAPVDLGLIVIAGVAALFGQMVLSHALGNAPAAKVAPTLYSQLIWAVLGGLIFFSEVPDALTILGLVVISGSGLFLIQRRPKSVVAVPGPLP